MKEIKKYIISRDEKIKAALNRLNENPRQVLFVVDEGNRLFGSLTDGDIRRWILKTSDLSTEVGKICNQSPKFLHDGFTLGIPEKIFLENKINALPVINSRDEICDIIFKDETEGFSTEQQNKKIRIPAVIMAGGKGTRLDPFTRILPKPLIPIGNRAIIQIIIDEYYKYGISDFYISINHKSKIIRAFFEENNTNGYKINYIEEDKPLGTAGALKYMNGKFSTPFFVSNCDIIIKEDYTKIYDFHNAGGYSLTMVAALRQFTIPYGICELDAEEALKEVIEKPEYNFLVNTGMYLLSPEVLNLIPDNQFYHITNLISDLKSKGGRIGVFPVSGKAWLDVGQWKEYKETLKQLL